MFSDASEVLLKKDESRLLLELEELPSNKEATLLLSLLLLVLLKRAASELLLPELPPFSCSMERTAEES